MPRHRIPLGSEAHLQRPAGYSEDPVSAGGPAGNNAGPDSVGPSGLQAERAPSHAAARALASRRALLLLAGLLMFSTAPVSEILIRTFFESQGARIYSVRDVLRGIDRVPPGNGAP